MAAQVPQPQPQPTPQPPTQPQPASLQPPTQPQPASQPPAQQPQPASQPQQPPRQHVHHSYVWLGTIRVMITILFVSIISAFSSIVGVLAEGRNFHEGQVSPWIIVAIVAACFVVTLAVVIVIHIFSYRHLYYQMGADEFNLYSGIFNKKRVHVPYQRIQSVDQRASLLQRIFGVCSVSIDTAGGASNKAVMVPYLQKSQAEQLRAELFARKQYITAVQDGVAPQQAAVAVAAASGVVLPQAEPFMQPQSADPSIPSNILDAPAEIWDDVRGIFGGIAVDTGRVTYEYGLDNKELMFTALSNNTAFFLVVMGILGGVAQLASEFAPLMGNAFEPTVGRVVAVGSQLFGGNIIAAGVVAIIGLVLLVWLLSLISTFLSYGGFRACRRDNRIEVERGLLQHRFQGVGVDRVQSIIVKQSFIRRLLGYCELSLGKIDATEGSDEQQNSLSEGFVVHPFVKLNRVPDILAGLVPEFSGVPANSTPVAPVALRRALIRRGIVQGTGFWLAVLIALTQIGFNVLGPHVQESAQVIYYVNAGAFIGYALCVVLFILDLVSAVLWFKDSGFAYNNQFMQVSNGGFSRETVSFPRKKIQYGYTKTNPFQRRAVTATINARTAAGIGGTTVRLIDVREEDASRWLDWLRPRGNVIE